MDTPLNIYTFEEKRLTFGKRFYVTRLSYSGLDSVY